MVTDDRFCDRAEIVINHVGICAGDSRSKAGLSLERTAETLLNGDDDAPEREERHRDDVDHML